MISTYVLRTALGFFIFFKAVFIFADDRNFVEKLSVIGQRKTLPSNPGSGHIIPQKELNKFGFNDIHRALRKVPSVHVQEEEGFGLRPNIGLRAAHPHRSRKITLMEDGVLIAPAPYAAPAAYYFPQLDRMESIEVFKGTPSTRFGPNSIGGALNLVTKINEQGVQAATTHGSYNFAKYDLSTGFDFIGDLSLDYNRIETTGFKKLKSRDNTGFVRNNFSFRWDRYFQKFNQSLTFKFNWSDENSNETYTGLSRVDFELDSLQRYRATELDKMIWNHRQFFLSHSFDPLEDFHVRSIIYHHELDRSWFKLNGFFDNRVNLRTLLRNPHLSSNNYFYRILKGEENSGILSDNRDVLDLGNNQRQYLSQGVQMTMDYDFNAYGVDHLFYLSYRYHQDSVDRFHESRYYDMNSGRLKFNSSLGQTIKVLNKSEAKALSFSFNYQVLLENLSFNIVTRYEDISYGQTNFLDEKILTPLSHRLSTGNAGLPTITDETGELNRMSAKESSVPFISMKSKDYLLAPGFGLFYEMLPSLGLLVGVNKGFTPKGPGQKAGVQPEEAVNYELGLRYEGFVSFEVISFLSDYKNISGICTQSRGCQLGQLDQVFNGGKARVSGLDFLLSTDLKIRSVSLPIHLTTTFTRAEFKNSFQADFPDWGVGSVFPGDPIPYLPEWRSNLALGLEWKNFSGYLNLNYRDEMADQAVALGEDSVNREFIKKRFLVGLSLRYKVSKNMGIRFRVDNLTNQYYEVSQRPFGLRPGRPRFFLMGVHFAFH